MLLRRLQAQGRRGRAYQPHFHVGEIVAAWFGGALAISLLGLLGGWSHYPLVAAPLGASTVLLFGAPESPFSQPRNIVMGNGLGALVSVACVAGLGQAPWVMGLAVGLTIALSQRLRCLHPPAGAVALLGVLLKATPAYVLSPILVGSALLVLIAVLFHRLRPASGAYPHLWI